MGYVYKITNTVNGKSYIGISVNEPEKHRIKDHLAGRGNRIIANAVKKYGKDAFTYEILEANVFDELLPNLEVAYIDKFNSVAPHGYNLTSGGEKNKIPSKETLRKLSALNSGKKNPNFGKQHSVSTRLKISNAQRGKKRKPLTAEHRQKISDSNKGKTMSAEARLKISAANKGQRTGENNHNYGKRFSSEHRRKIGESNKGKTISESHRKKISRANRSPYYAEAHDFFSSLSTDMTLREKHNILFQEFPSVSKATIYKWIRKWTGKSFSRRLSEYDSAYAFFLSLPDDIPLQEKRKLIYTQFPNINRRTIRDWVHKWLKESD